jgi:hypothetical protein
MGCCANHHTLQEGKVHQSVRWTSRSHIPGVQPEILLYLQPSSARTAMSSQSIGILLDHWVLNPYRRHKFVAMLAAVVRLPANDAKEPRWSLAVPTDNCRKYLQKIQHKFDL